MSDINKVDYSVLSTATTTYARQAAAIDDVLTALINMNSELAGGWTNKTSEAFLDRFEREYKVNLQQVRDAVQELSDYIEKYSQNRQEEDAEGASAIG